AEIEPWLDLAQAQIRRSRPADAERTLRDVLARHPEDPQALELLALARAAQGNADDAIEILRRVLALPSISDRAEAEYNLARLLTVRGRVEEAEEHLKKAVAARPNLVTAWYHLGEIRAGLGRNDEALPCWRRALEIDPTHTKSYLSLARALLAAGDRDEALRLLRHGAQAAAHPEEVAAALRDVDVP
ncbi:tetratricopeptide repeat protein, partial [bacterium]